MTASYQKHKVTKSC